MRSRKSLALALLTTLSGCDFGSYHPISPGNISAAADEPKIAGFVSLHDLLERVSCDLLAVKQKAHGEGVDFPNITGSIYVTVAKQSEYDPTIGLTIPVLAGVTFGPKAKLDVTRGDTRTLTIQFVVKDPAGTPDAACAESTITLRPKGNAAGSKERLKPLFTYEDMQHVFDPKSPVKFSEEDFKGAFELKRTISTNGEIDFLIVKLDPLAAGFTSDYVQGFEVKFSTQKAKAPNLLLLMQKVGGTDIVQISNSVVFQQSGS